VNFVVIDVVDSSVNSVQHRVKIL